MLHDYLLLTVTAALAGAVNALAGGGTLLTFPALFAALGSTAEAAVIANATSTVALVTGYLSALYGYRREMVQVRHWAWLLILPSILGGWLGSELVVRLPAGSFRALVPWLILTAAVLFALQPTMTRWTRASRPTAGGGAWRSKTGAILFQFLVAVYGGYFGAGIGILMLASLGLMGVGNIHQMNALKMLLAFLINCVAVVVFIMAGYVHWRFAIAMAIASIVGGYVAAHTARRLDATIVRRIVVAIGFTLAAYYFYRQWAT